MAQHPDKIKWKGHTPHGLSASQFGMALGLCGRVVDFVDYLRNVVGTELEFTGNASTSHGIVTEPKARSLYELLTGDAVSDGGFFLTDDGLLGCSPDGRIFYRTNSQNGDTQNNVKGIITNGEVDTTEKAAPRVKIPFRSKWQPQVCSTSSLQSSPTQEKFRLLEIKSPFHSLYDGSKSAYQPFGIPQQYLCQMQGQMAIAGVNECDFFVYLDKPACQVVAWRVRRSEEFWEWASPKLRQVAQWVRDGPPLWLNRSFSFGTFDFSKIMVEPLIFPYDITANAPIRDAHRFPFFERHPNPYESMSLSDVQDALLRSLMSPITRFLFYSETDSQTQDGTQKEECVMWCRLEKPTAEWPMDGNSWNSLNVIKHSANDTTRWNMKVTVKKPNDFDNGMVMCSVHNREGDFNWNSDNSLSVRFFQRLFFTSLVPLTTRSPTPEVVAHPTVMDTLTSDSSREESVNEHNQRSLYSTNANQLNSGKRRSCSTYDESVIVIESDSTARRSVSIEVCTLSQETIF
ncbi:YqaJ viral recombinase [Trypanosoma melophagium]|uniref:YqaJ viral recombinase n=1 Tax=Trypanosoma melophagium TaxID=715481 RepID=UPI00351A0447|nr:YqaJ viral recombinase [Trypanosoma melophagium]